MESLQKKHRKAINDAAARMRTCIIHEQPVEFAHWFPPCLLHMRTIEKGRFLKKVENVACSLTMAHNLHGETLLHKNTSLAEEGGIYETVPNILHCPQKAYLLRYVHLLKRIGVGATSSYMFSKYSFNDSPVTKTKTTVDPDTGKQQRYPRLGGEQADKINANAAQILDTLKDIPSQNESDRKRADRIIPHATFIHLSTSLQCLVSL